MIKKSIKDCEYFFFDSGPLIDLLRIDLSGLDESSKKRTENVQRFFNSLNDPKTFGRKRKMFQLSAISIAEIFHVDGKHENTVKAMATALDSNDVEIISFDEDAALFHNAEFYNSLSNKEVDALKKLVTASGFVTTRERVRRDMMIAATAKMYKTDIALTTDGGFKTICDKYDISCHLFTDSDTQFLTSQDGKLIYDFANKNS
jgi:predicted nucleic acid-binding protein